MGNDGPNPAEINTREELATALTELRVNANLTVRELARRIDTPAGTLGGYFSGRHLPSTAQLPLLGRAIEACGVIDLAEVERWTDAVRRARRTSDGRVARPTAPYRGLKPFEPEDAGLFFGRGPETHAILERIVALSSEPGPSSGVLAVIGPSGSGKSSLLRAGVTGGIRAGVLDSPTTRWSVTITTPTGDISAALDTGADGPAVVVIDQFEELFTSFDTRRTRLALLRQLADRPRGIVLVLGMRADFYAEAARESALRAALEHAQVLVGPMDKAAVREVISTPAQRGGITIEDGLTDLLLADLAPRDAAGTAAYDAGALPLLSHALLATWERSSGRRITVADYRATGGIGAAVQQTAEDLYGSLSAAEREVARRQFLRLVHINDDIAVTRRRVSLDELTRIVGDGVDARSVVDRFVERRLLTAGDTSVAISHETLLSAWPRLREWVDADRAGLRLHRQITEAATVWKESAHDPATLLRGARLQNATEWSADDAHRSEMDPLEVEFVDTGARQAEAEATRERRRGRRLRRLLAAVAVLALLASGLAAYAFTARSEADHQRATAALARDDALSRQVAVESREVSSADPALAQQLAIASYGFAHTNEARSAVLDRSVAQPITRLLGTLGATPLAVSPAGPTIAVGNADDGSIRLLTAPPGGVPVPTSRIPGAPKSGQLKAVAFSPNGELLASGGQEQMVHLYDVSNPKKPRSVAVLHTSFTDAVQSLAFGPNGTTLVASGQGKSPVLVWNIANPSAPEALPGPRGIADGTTIKSVAFDPSGKAFAATGTSGTYVWPAGPVPGAKPLVTPHHASVVNVVRFDPARDLIYTGDNRGEVSVLAVRGPELVDVHRFVGDQDGSIAVLAVSPDGRQLAVGSATNSLRQFNTSDWHRETITSIPGPVGGVAYTADSLDVVATGADGSLREWRASARTITIEGTAFDLGYAAERSRLAVSTNGTGTLRVLDTSNRAAPRVLGPQLKPPLPSITGAAAIRPDGNLFAAGAKTGQVALLDIKRPRDPHTVAVFRAARSVRQLAFSGDGHTLAVSSDHKISLWDVRDPARPDHLSTVHGSGSMLNVVISPDGNLVAGADADGRVYLWGLKDPRKPQPVAALHGFRGYVFGVAFSPDGHLLAASGADGTSRLWKLTSSKKPVPVGKPLVGPTGSVFSVAFSPDSSRLAVASADSDVTLYRVSESSHRRIATLRALTGNVIALAFSPQGGTLVAGGRAAALYLWTTDADAVTKSVCAVAGDPITRQEWKQYVPGEPYDPPCKDGKPT